MPGRGFEQRSRAPLGAQPRRSVASERQVEWQGKGEETPRAVSNELSSKRGGRVSEGGRRMGVCRASQAAQ